MKTLLGLACALFISLPTLAQAQQLTWSYPAGTGVPAIDWRTLASDVKITGITFDYDLGAGSYLDYCVNVYRYGSGTDYLSESGGYSEIICLNPQFWATAGHWNQYLDLTSTPLYLPADTKIQCGTSGGGTAATQGARSCVINYQPYVAGDPRYRFLRIPYLDTTTTVAAAWDTSQYIAPVGTPLVVKGLMLYDGFSGTYTGCLTHISVNQCTNTNTVSESVCRSGTKTTSTNNGSYGVIPVDWTIYYPDILSASVTSSNVQMDWDAAFYAIIQIPSSYAVGPQNIVRNYGNLNATYVNNYCTNWVTNLGIPAQKNQLCYAYDVTNGIAGGTACSDAQLISACGFNTLLQNATTPY